MFADYARIEIRSGKGGDGHVSFRREKYVPNGGPDGGNGGDGGDVIFEVDKSRNTLFEYKHRYAFRAEDGEEGGKKRQHGANGRDIVIRVPEGTLVREENSGKVIADLSGETQRTVVLKGGRGGKGNMNFATSRMQAPRYAEPGKPGIRLVVILELKLVADVGLVGFPNAGKSTLLSVVTNAKPKIADYPFTTISPNLGVVEFGDGRGFVLADIPGLIEGASDGVGLGHEFLRHIERTRMLVHVVDAASFEGRDPVDDVRAINEELRRYDPGILKKPMIIAANKIDAIDASADDPVARLKDEFEKEGIPVFPISAAARTGTQELLREIMNILEHSAPPIGRYEQEFFPEDLLTADDLPYSVEQGEDFDGSPVYILEGPKIEKMLGYTNLESERGFQYFQRFLKDNGILDDLKRAGIRDGDTVKMYGHRFDFYDDDRILDEDAP